MALILDGTNGLSDVDGSAATPAIRGSDANTGIFFPAADTIAFAEGGVESMRLDSNGNVGIGTSSPVRPLVLRTGASVSSVIKLANADSGETLTDGFDLAFDGLNGYLNLRESGILAFNTNATERMRIAGTGLLVGATASVSSSVPGVQIYQNGPNGGSINIANNITGTFDGVMSFINGNGTVGKINTSGSATTYATSSDYRLKHDIQPMAGALAKVAALKPVTYKWKSDDSDGEGFIAHELQEVVPECVTGEKDAVDADGNPQYQGIDTSFLVATLTAAIQEQQAIITALTARVEALEGAQA